MSENVLQTMEAVRAARGLNPINPFVIDGTGSPFPPLSLEDLAAEAGKPPPQTMPEQHVPEVPTPAPIRYPQEEIQQEHDNEPVYVLMIGDSEASYHGQHVQLSEAEQAAIASIVLRAITANVKAQYQALLSRLPKRVRVQKTRKRKANA